MRKRIQETIKNVGLNLNDFIIGYGARNDHSEIHFPKQWYETTAFQAVIALSSIFS